MMLGMRPAEQKNGPLKGIRILDFTWYVVGPAAPRLAANLGAEVIKVERVDDFDQMRSTDRGMGNRGKEPVPQGSPDVSGLFNNWNTDKLAITLNTRHPEGLQLAEQLIA